MTKINVAEYLFKKIADEGVDFLPIYQSGNALRLIDAVGTNEKLNEFVNYHEQASGLSAEAYARFKKLGACLVGSGPAATNLSTAIMSAYCDSIPTIFITGQVGMFHNKLDRNIRQRGFQEVDVAEHMKPIAKYSKLIKNVEDVRYEIEKSIYLAINGRPGPVVLDIPYNIQIAEINPDDLKSYNPIEDEENNIQLNNLDDNLFGEILAKINKSERPIMLLGGGIKSIKNIDQILTFINKLKLPVVTTWAATDVIDFYHTHNLGNIGRSGNRSAIYAVQESDLLLSLGSRFTTKIITDEKKFAKDAHIIGIDIDNGELEEGLIKIDTKIIADIKEFVPKFTDYLDKTNTSLTLKEKWNSTIDHHKKNNFIIDETLENLKPNCVSPYYFMKKAFEIADNTAIFIPDAGMNITWTYQGNRLKKGQKIFTGLGASPMGYALPAAIGAYYATHSNQVIVIAGDGGFQMNIQELEALHFHNIPIKIFIMNNESLGNTIFPSKRMFEGRTTGNDNAGGYGWPDFVDVAKAYKIKSLRFSSHKDIDQNLSEILNSESPYLVDVKLDPDQFMLDTPI